MSEQLYILRKPIAPADPDNIYLDLACDEFNEMFMPFDMSSLRTQIQELFVKWSSKHQAASIIATKRSIENHFINEVLALVFPESGTK